MEISEFWQNVFASMVAALILTGLGKITLKYWKNIVVSFGAALFIAAVGSVVILGVSAAIKSYKDSVEISYLQDKIDRYTRGNYKMYYEKGWRIDLHKVKPRLILAFTFPERASSYQEHHPLYSKAFIAGIKNLLKNEGYAQSPYWVFELRALDENEFNMLLEPKAG